MVTTDDVGKASITLIDDVWSVVGSYTSSVVASASVGSTGDASDSSGTGGTVDSVSGTAVLGSTTSMLSCSTTDVVDSRRDELDSEVGAVEGSVVVASVVAPVVASVVSSVVACSGLETASLSEDRVTSTPMLPPRSLSDSGVTSCASTEDEEEVVAGSAVVRVSEVVVDCHGLIVDSDDVEVVVVDSEDVVEVVVVDRVEVVEVVGCHELMVDRVEVVVVVSEELDSD